MRLYRLRVFFLWCLGTLHAVGVASEQARVAFAVRDPQGRPLCVRVLAEGDRETFSRIFAGRVELSLSAGSWKVTVSRGPEWELFTDDIELEPGKALRKEIVLRRVVDPEGLVSVDPIASPGVKEREREAEGLDYAFAWGELEEGVARDPRSEGGIFTRAGLCPFTGEAQRSELLRSLWGLVIGQGGDQTAWWAPLGAENALRFDWFHLLTRGMRVHLLAGSGSGGIVGMPRLYVPEPQGRSVLETLRQGPDSVSWGIVVRLWAEGRPAGTVVQSRFGKVRLRVLVQAAPWVDTRELTIFAGTEAVLRTDLRPYHEPVRLDRTYELQVPGDTVYVAAASGKEALLPYRPKRISPLGIAGPVWVDGDGDGRFTPAQRRAARILARWAGLPHGALRALEREPAWVRLQAGPVARDRVVVDHLADDRDAQVRYAVYASLGRRQPAWATEVLLRRLVQCDKEPAEAASVAGALCALGVGAGLERLAKRFHKAGPRVRPLAVRQLERYAKSPATWQVVGPFDDPDGLGLRGRYGPEGTAEPGRSYRDIHGKIPLWKELSGGRTDTTLSGGAQPVVYFAVCCFALKRGTTVGVCVRARYGCAAWIDGREVLFGPRAQGTALFGVVYLGRGSHRLVLELPCLRAETSFWCGLLDPSGTLRFGR